jgi:hypothetical protein
LHQVLANEALAAQALLDRRLAGGLGEEDSEGAANTGLGSHGARDRAAIVPHHHATGLFHDLSGGTQPLDGRQRGAQRLIEASRRIQPRFTGQSPTRLLEHAGELRCRQQRSKLAQQRRQHHLITAGRLAARRRLIQVSRFAGPPRTGVRARRVRPCRPLGWDNFGRDRARERDYISYAK